MFTLAQAAREARLLLKYGGILLVGFFVLFFLFKLAVFIKNTFFPTPVAPPEEKYGVLPKLNFKTDSTFQPKYRIETNTGFLPVFSDRARVFKFLPGDTNILTVQSIRDHMKTVGFSENEKKLDEIIYQWESKDYPEKTITYNIFSKNFEIKYPFYTDNNVLAATNLATGNKAVSIVQDFLTRIGEDTTDIDQNSTLVTYYRLDGGKLTKISDKKDAQIVQVSLFQKSIDDIKTLYNYYNDSDMTFYLGSGEEGTHIVEAYYRHRRIDEGEYSTYSIITADEAYQHLLSGNALILQKGPTENIDILNIYLAYFMNSTDDEYFVPVIVFEGKDFKAYVEAIGKPMPTPTGK